MESKKYSAARFSVFIDMEYWHAIMNIVKPIIIDDSPERFVIYLSTTRGDCINFTYLFSESDTDQTCRVQTIIEHIESYLMRHNSKSTFDLINNNDEIFMDFPSQVIYYNIHNNTLKNFNREENDLYLQEIKEILTLFSLDTVLTEGVSYPSLLYWTTCYLGIIVNSIHISQEILEHIRELDIVHHGDSNLLSTNLIEQYIELVDGSQEATQHPHHLAPLESALKKITIQSHANKDENRDIKRIVFDLLTHIENHLGIDMANILCIMERWNLRKAKLQKNVALR
ncbi:hypothetical protein [Sphingobacterium sp. JB170]|uniref:hypothetical protein n=1 Tax=Sphingobacterium sp. JB170 TaxID=1434842 RepID=UPI00097EC4C9|nr:hypothetical protein [Sphingobacterium sp. JB170]SJN49815.1 hypothetical protein FM107_19270 [Sphingobacterium sp. JB170]